MESRRIKISETRKASLPDRSTFAAEGGGRRERISSEKTNSRNAKNSYEFSRDLTDLSERIFNRYSDIAFEGLFKFEGTN